MAARLGGELMSDVLMVGCTLLLFGLSRAYVGACERLKVKKSND